MKKLGILGLIATGVVLAHPVNVNTVIDKSNYNRAMWGSADDDVFADHFLGYPPGTIIKDFKVTCGKFNCTVSATVDFLESPKFNPPDNFNPPGGGDNPHNDPPGGNPPGGNPPGGHPPGDGPPGDHHDVPEIDPGAGGTALSLLAGVMLVLRGRRKTA